MMTSATPGEHVDKTFKYDCAECDVTDIFCNGESVLSAGRVSVVKASSLFSFSFPSFEDNNACVYLVVYKKESKSYRQVLAVIENASVIAKLPAPIESPAIGAQSEIEIPLSCEDCTVEKVFVNGVMLDSAPTRRTGTNPVAYFMASPTAITIRISEFSANYEGIYQAQFDVKGEQVTKTIMEIKNPNDKSSSSDEGDATTAAATEAGGDATTAAGDATAAAEGETTAADGEATTAEGGGEETEAPPEGRKKG